MARPTIGDVVEITGGTYKGKEGIYKGKTVTGKSVYVLVDGEMKTIRKSSIEKSSPERQIQEVKAEMADLVKRMEKLQLKINALE